VNPITGWLTGRERFLLAASAVVLVAGLVVAVTYDPDLSGADAQRCLDRIAVDLGIEPASHTVAPLADPPGWRVQATSRRGLLQLDVALDGRVLDVALTGSGDGNALTREEALPFYERGC
jgi:hypothetical protein